MLVDTLVTDGIYLAMQDEQFEPAIPGGLETIALRILNNIFGEWKEWIPYAIKYTYNDVALLQNTKFVTVDLVEFILPGGTVKYLTNQKDLRRFEEQNGVIDLKAPPTNYYFEPQTQTILVYPNPQFPSYTFVIWGRTALGPLELGSELSANMPDFMISACIYQLARRLASKYGLVWTPEKEQDRQELISNMKSQRVIELSPPVNNVFGNPGSRKVAPYPWFYAISGGQQQ